MAAIERLPYGRSSLRSSGNAVLQLSGIERLPSDKNSLRRPKSVIVLMTAIERILVRAGAVYVNPRMASC